MCGYQIEAPPGRRIKATLNALGSRQRLYDGPDDQAPQLTSDGFAQTYERSFLVPTDLNGPRFLESSGRFLYYRYFLPIENGLMFFEIDFQYVVI